MVEFYLLTFPRFPLRKKPTIAVPTSLVTPCGYTKTLNRINKLYCILYKYRDFGLGMDRNGAPVDEMAILDVLLALGQNTKTYYINTILDQISQNVQKSI